MAQKGIREFDAKRLLAAFLPDFVSSIKYDGRLVLVDPETDLSKLTDDNPWLKDARLVVKPDQLFGKRGKNNLLLLDADLDSARAWISERMEKEVEVGNIRGKLTHFLIEPFIPHDTEYYMAIRSNRDNDVIYFSLAGGIDIEENWGSVVEITVPAPGDIDKEAVGKQLPLKGIDNKDMIVGFVTGLYRFYRKLNFTYLEINPFTLKDTTVVPLDMVARLDDTAAFECSRYWGNISFPVGFGKKLTEEEKYVQDLDAKSGASLKLTVLNPDGRIWLMVAGGGASVIYTDTVVDLGMMSELANYGEYSGDPSTDLTREYARTILDLMTRTVHPKGKVLLIGGGIANFTDVAKTFTGIIQTLEEYREKLIGNNIRIYVRRGGPNYQEGLAKMRKLGDRLGVSIEVYGPETHMTKIVSSAKEALAL